jgi:uncharacterized protein YkwD
MVRRRYFGHERAGSTLATRLAATKWSGTSAAEAIAWGCDRQGTAIAMLAAWLASPPHNAILLGAYDRIGIGLQIGAPANDGCKAAGTWVIDVGTA